MFPITLPFQTGWVGDFYDFLGDPCHIALQNRVGRLTFLNFTLKNPAKSPKHPFLAIW